MLIDVVQCPVEPRLGWAVCKFCLARSALKDDNAISSNSTKWNLDPGDLGEFLNE